MVDDLIPMKNSALKMLANKRIAQENGVKTIDPPIKRSQTTDPETGAITYRQSWESSSSTRRTSSGKKTAPSVRKTTSISPVGSRYLNQHHLRPLPLNQERLLLFQFLRLLEEQIMRLKLLQLKYRILLNVQLERI